MGLRGTFRSQWGMDPVKLLKLNLSFNGFSGKIPENPKGYEEIGVSGSELQLVRQFWVAVIFGRNALFEGSVLE